MCYLSKSTLHLLDPDCLEGKKTWHIHGDAELAVDPPEVAGTIMDESNATAELDGQDPKVCFQITGRIVRMFAIHFWAAGISAVEVQLFNNLTQVAGEVRHLWPITI